jgi:hypothetical protein
MGTPLVTPHHARAASAVGLLAERYIPVHTIVPVFPLTNGERQVSGSEIVRHDQSSRHKRNVGQQGFPRIDALSTRRRVSGTIPRKTTLVMQFGQ